MVKSTISSYTKIYFMNVGIISWLLIVPCHHFKIRKLQILNSIFPKDSNQTPNNKKATENSLTCRFTLMQTHYGNHVPLC